LPGGGSSRFLASEPKSAGGTVSFGRRFSQFKRQVQRRVLSRLFTYSLGMSQLYREMHTRKFMEKAVEDNAVLFWDYDDFVRRNLEIFAGYVNARALEPQRVLCMEFGVLGGRSINFMSGILTDYRFFGFDSFEGFRSVKRTSFWSGYQKRFSGQSLPVVNKNVSLIRGYAEDTLPAFIATQIADVEAFLVHCDMDIYEPTKVVLDWVVSSDKKFFLMFDELLNYSEFPLHEYRAFMETIVAKKVPYRIHTMCDHGEDTFGVCAKVFLEIR
jgi:hypothetical protein